MKLSGSYVALATPFNKDNSLDENAFRRLVRMQLGSGTAGLVPCGSTGEGSALSHEEYRRVIELTLLESGGRIPVIAGVASNVTDKAAALAREAESLGADAVLLLTPYYNKPTQEGLYQHFRTVARGLRTPIIAYNIPGRTGVNLLPKTLLRLVQDVDNIIAVKEAAGSVDQVSEILAGTPARFTVLSGDDSLTLPMISVGAKGVVTVAGNIAPKQITELCSAALAGDKTKASRLHLKLFPLVKALFLETNPIPVKTALELMGLCSGRTRLPLTELSTENRKSLKAALRSFGLI